MHKWAIVFSVESKKNSNYEKLSIILSTSIREHMPDIDVYCGCFTNNLISDYTKKYLKILNINLQEFPIFDGQENDACFHLRLYTKHFFAKRLLQKYDYLVYVDHDTLFLKPLKFDFNPLDEIVLVETIPDWAKMYESKRTFVPEGNLYYNWIQVINHKNKFLYDLDFSSIEHLKVKLADSYISKRIDKSGLKIIEQNVGANHCMKPLTKKSQIIHYDDLGFDGCFIDLESIHPKIYKKYKFFIEKVLNLKIENEKDYFKKVRDYYLQEMGKI